MNYDYLEKLPTCASEEEVWELFKSQVFPNSNESLFNSGEITLKVSEIKYSPIIPPSETIGLAYRTVLFLKLNGVFGKIITGGGCYTIGGALLRVLNSFLSYKKFNSPLEITSNMIDRFILEGQEKGNSVFSTYRDLFQIEHWLNNNARLPYFLRLTTDLLSQSKLWGELKESKDKEFLEYTQDIGGSNPIYPLNQLKIIVNEAIEYIDNYSDDCVDAARIYKQVKNLQMSSEGTRNRITKILFNQEHLFTEPNLKMIQEHIKASRKTYWTKMEGGLVYGPLVCIVESIRKLQGACSIIILMLTAMRRGEFNTLKRYPDISPSEHNEIDNSFQLSYIIYKTAFTEAGDESTVPVPQYVVKSIYLLSVLSELKDDEKIGYINLSSFSKVDSKHNDYRVNSVIFSFCNELEIEPPNIHQFRHAMAFIVAYMNDAHGIELAMTLLGHKSIEMTKKYLGHYKQIVQNNFDIMYEENDTMREVYLALKETLDKEALENVIEQIELESPMVGPIIKRIPQFSGSLTQEAKIFFSKSLRLVVEKGIFAVTQFPTHFCIKDLTDSTQMACQIGLNLDDYKGAPILPLQCEPKCGCRLYTGANIEILKELTDEVEEAYPDELRERLQQNTYFDAESFKDPYKQYIHEHEIITKKRSS